MSRSELPAPACTDADRYSYRLEFIDEQGTQVHEWPLTVKDFERAVSEATFEGFRSGQLEAYAPDFGAARIEPRLGQSDDPARSHGFRVVLSQPDGTTYGCDFPLGYFQGQASLARAAWRRTEKSPAEGTLSFRLAAYLEDQASKPLDGWQMEFDPPEFRVPVRKVAREHFGAGEPWDSPGESGLPILMEHSLVADACEEASRNSDREVGGLLLGHVCQDPDTGGVFLLVTCLVSAEGTTEATATSVTFSPESFARAQEMIQLRARPNEPPEILVGWFHSHPFRFCSECPLPVPRECIQKVLFFSVDDIQLMESTFPHPYMVGLLAGVEPRLEAAVGHLPVRLFGWKRGEISAVGFHVLDP